MKNNKELKITCPVCNSEIIIYGFHGQDEFCKKCKSWIMASYILEELEGTVYEN